MPYEAYGHGTILLNEEIYVFGGYTDIGSTNKLYKLNKELEWEELASMKKKREFIGNSSVVLDGEIWVIGGSFWNRKSVEKYDSRSNKWEYMP